MKYEIRHYQDHTNYYILLATTNSLAEARELRKASGDLVVEAITNVVVADPCWLWDWEAKQPNSYALQNLGLHRPGTIIAPRVDWFGRYGGLHA